MYETDVPVSKIDFLLETNGAPSGRGPGFFKPFEHPIATPLCPTDRKYLLLRHYSDFCGYDWLAMKFKW